MLTLGFYAHFAPVSYSADEDPSSPGFNSHKGFEADLLTALESMESPRLSLSRHGLPLWDDIWLRSATTEYDVVGGGITVLDSRTRDAAGNTAVAFTSGHVTFRQSLLVRAEDADRVASHADLTGDMRVGALAGTTGEHRLLELLGLVDDAGVLLAGVRVDTAQGPVVADGSETYYITAAGASTNLEGRSQLYPPTAGRPQVVYLGEKLGEAELLRRNGSAILAEDVGFIFFHEEQIPGRNRQPGCCAGIGRSFCRYRPGRTSGNWWVYRSSDRHRPAGLPRRKDQLAHQRPEHRLRGMAGQPVGLPRTGQLVERQKPVGHYPDGKG